MNDKLAAFVAQFPNEHEQADLLAKAFTRVLTGWLTPAEMDTVRQRNRTADYANGACASHDFCDANMAMAEAFTRIIGHEIDIDSQGDVDRWNTAWCLAKAREFR